MPIPPKNALKFTCQDCGWSHVFKPRSDVIFHPGRCKRCGSDRIEMTAASPSENLKATVVAFIRRYVR